MNPNHAPVKSSNLSSGINPYVFVSYEYTGFGFVAVIDPVKNEIIQRIPVGNYPGPMCLNEQEDKLYVLSTSRIRSLL
ncbi:hypothetical protein MHI24_06500 [Paenibacillus sp. FSL K6-1096]|uniref:hypothetical protein n=1 Tax=Paenibacillus sp. FSL K6-1096 TaxID=2921460 RepID=UPI0030EB8C9F